MPDTAARRRLVRRLLETEAIASQTELVDRLATAGHPASQATVSRDLGALGASRTPGPDGGLVYRITGPPGIPGELRGVLDAYAVSIASSGNLVVVRTPPAAAQMVASAIDLAGVGGVIGTMAGDDTVIVVVDESTEGGAVAALLRGAS